MKRKLALFLSVLMVWSSVFSGTIRAEAEVLPYDSETETEETGIWEEESDFEEETEESVSVEEVEESVSAEETETEIEEETVSEEAVIETDTEVSESAEIETEETETADVTEIEETESAATEIEETETETAEATEIEEIESTETDETETAEETEIEETESAATETEETETETEEIETAEETGIEETESAESEMEESEVETETEDGSVIEEETEEESVPEAEETESDVESEEAIESEEAGEAVIGVPAVDGYDESFEKPVQMISSYGSDRLLLNTASVADKSYTIPGLTATRDQGKYGTCWAFAMAASAEINMNQNYSVKDRDLSELQLAYSVCHNNVDPLGNITADTVTGNRKYCLQIGGNYKMGAAKLAAWQGFTSESTIPYSMASSVAGGSTIDAALIKQATVRMTDAYFVNPEIDRAAMKDLLVNCGPVAVSFDATRSCYNETTNCYFNPFATTANHGAAIVGWDDTIPVSNFQITGTDGGRTKPNNPGGWLVRNSWSTAGGKSYETYFWMSYESYIYPSGTALKCSTANRYDNNYQYDGCTSLGVYSDHPLLAGGTQVANVFTVKGCTDGEKLKAISFYTETAGVQYTVKVYKNITDLADPSGSGTLVSSATTSGTVAYPGFHTIPLANSVNLAYGTKFAVAIQLKDMSGHSASIGVEYPYVKSGTVDGKSYTINYNFDKQAGQSYLSGGRVWTDYVYDQEVGNFALKAFTVNLTNPTYTIKFNKNGATNGTMSAMTVDVGKTKTLTANAFTWTRHIFKGWNTKADGSGKSYSNKASVKDLASANGTVTLYAQWTTTCTITYKLNGGTNNTSNKKSFTTAATGSVTLYEPTKTGYVFKGWYKTSDFSGTPVTSLSKNTSKNYTVYAKWTPIKYKIVFDANGGTGTMDPMTSLKYDTSYKLTSNTFTRKGYIFKGWNTKADGSGTFYSNGAKILNLRKTSGTRKLYARWTTTCKITYKLNGGTNNSSNVTSFKIASTGTVKLYEPTRTGYTFKGWYTDKAFTNKVTSLSKNTSKNYTLYARWNTYTVTFDLNGGVGYLEPKECVYGKEYSLSRGETFYREGYTFLGWGTTKTVSKMQYPYDTKLLKTKAIAGDQLTLYAIWTKNENSAVKLDDSSARLLIAGNSYSGSISFCKKNDYSGSLTVTNLTPDVISDAFFTGSFQTSDFMRLYVNWTVGATGTGLLKVTNEKNTSVIYILVKKFSF